MLMMTHHRDILDAQLSFHVGFDLERRARRQSATDLAEERQFIASAVAGEDFQVEGSSVFVDVIQAKRRSRDQSEFGVPASGAHHHRHHPVIAGHFLSYAGGDSTTHRPPDGRRHVAEFASNEGRRGNGFVVQVMSVDF